MIRNVPPPTPENPPRRVGSPPPPLPPHAAVAPPLHPAASAREYQSLAFDLVYRLSRGIFAEVSVRVRIFTGGRPPTR